jgi:hypothetical protein
VVVGAGAAGGASVMELHSDIEIEAPPDQVWDVLTDFDAYPDWNPFVRRIDGEPVVGTQLEVVLEPPGGRAMTFQPEVLAAQPTREFRWLGRLWGVPKLFDGEHIFEIEPLGQGRTRFVQREKFSGVLVPLLARSLMTNTRRGFEAMNRALKERVEAAQ